MTGTLPYWVKENVQDLLSDKTLVIKASCSSARLAIFPACFVIISFVWRTTCIHPSTNNAKPKNCIILLNRGLLKYTISSCQKWECKTSQLKWQIHTSVGHQLTLLLLLLLLGFYQDLEKRNKPTNLGGTSASFPSHPLLTELLLLPVFSCFAIPIHIMGSHVVP